MSYPDGLHLALASLVAVAATACSVAPPRMEATPAPDSLKIQALVRSSQTSQGDWHPILQITVKNRADVPVAFSRTHGVTSPSWLFLEIEDESGNLIHYSSDVDVFRRRPEYLCLDPGGRLVWSIDLLDWSVMFGGKTWGRPDAFDLKPGRYRLRVRYSDHPNRSSASCPVINGVSYSQWTDFFVQDD